MNNGEKRSRGERAFSNSRRMGLMKVAETVSAASRPNSMDRAMSDTYRNQEDMMMSTTPCHYSHVPRRHPPQLHCAFNVRHLCIMYSSIW